MGEPVVDASLGCDVVYNICRLTNEMVHKAAKEGVPVHHVKATVDRLQHIVNEYHAMILNIDDALMELTGAPEHQVIYMGLVQAKISYISRTQDAVRGQAREIERQLDGLRRWRRRA